MAQGLLDEADGRAEVKALTGWLACANAAAGDRRGLLTRSAVIVSKILRCRGCAKSQNTCIIAVHPPPGHCPAPSKMPELCRELPGSIVDRTRGRSRPLRSTTGRSLDMADRAILTTSRRLVPPAPEPAL